MKKLSTVAVALIAVALAGVSGAKAGLKSSGNVLVVKNADGSGSAQGAVGDARNSADNNQRIYCTISVSNSNSNVSCYASDSGASHIVCSSSDATLIDVARGINSTSYIDFSLNSSGVCTRIKIASGSIYTIPVN